VGRNRSVRTGQCGPSGCGGCKGDRLLWSSSGHRFSIRTLRLPDCLVSVCSQVALTVTGPHDAPIRVSADTGTNHDARKTKRRTACRIAVVRSVVAPHLEQLISGSRS